MRLVEALRARLHVVVREMAKFGVVGAICFVVDVVVFTAARAVLDDKPITAGIISTLVAATLSYFLNRNWSFRHRQRSGVRREYMLFLLLNAGGMAISLSCLAISHYALGFESVLADNLAKNGVGLVLGTVFRFVAYRKWVFLAPEPAIAHAVAGGPVAEGPAMDPEPADLQPDARVP